MSTTILTAACAAASRAVLTRPARASWTLRARLLLLGPPPARLAALTERERARRFAHARAIVAEVSAKA